MKGRDFLEKRGLSSFKISLGFLEREFAPRDSDRAAAWELCVELLTRGTTQPLPPEDGHEKTALDSVHALFPLTHEILRRHGPGCGEFAKLAIPVLDQVIRPFTAKWHRLSLAGAFQDAKRCAESRTELAALQSCLRNYACALAAMAQAGDLSELECVGEQSPQIRPSCAC